MQARRWFDGPFQRLVGVHAALAVMCGLHLSGGVSGCAASSEHAFEDSDPSPAGRSDTPAAATDGSTAPQPEPGGASGAGHASLLADPEASRADAVVSPLNPNAPLSSLPAGEAQRKALCMRAMNEGRRDRVVQAFCQDAAPTVTSLKQLQSALNIAPGIANVALNGHTASLSVRSTSAINPRAILFQGEGPSAMALAYTRGEQAAEIVVRDAGTGNLNFYFAAYKQPCNATSHCAPADLLTPKTESGWTELSVYPSEDLENTALDCNSCHVVGGRRILRFQERQVTWTHWMFLGTPGGSALLADFSAAHGVTEEYAGIPGILVAASSPPSFEQFVETNGFADQPNEFASSLIEFGGTAVWQLLYNNFLAGNAIPVPYFKASVSDPNKISSMTSAYKSYVSGSSADLPDIRDVFVAQDLDKMAGINVPSTLAGQGLVTASCAQCHNSRLNQAITRARFNVDLREFSDLQGGVLEGAARDKELDKAVARVRLPDTDVEHMPPARIRSLSPSQIESLVSFFCLQMSQPSPDCP